MVRLRTLLSPFHFFGVNEALTTTTTETSVLRQLQRLSTSTFKHKQTHLLSLWLENPSTHSREIHQLHSILLTSGSLYPLRHFNALLRSYSLCEFPHQAFLLYKQLQQLYFHSPSLPPPAFDSFTYTFLLKTSGLLSCPCVGIQLHALTMKVGFQYHVYVQTALVNVYATCGLSGEGTRVFDEMPERNSVTWNVMISGLVKWGEVEIARSFFDNMPGRNVVSWTSIVDGYTRMNKHDEALALFRRMVVFDGIKPSEITILAIIPIILSMGDVRMCQSVHGYGEKRGFNVLDIRVTNALIDAYAKCGCIMSASRFFEEVPANRKNLVSWTSIISGFAMHGMGKEAVVSFERMEKTRLEPNRVTYLSVLNACSHGGLVEEGLKFFEKMINESRTLPDIKHYGCLIDMLGRAGRLEEAEKMALEVPSDIANVVIWRTLLGSCSFHGNVEMGERVTRKIMEIERGYGGDYVLMYNIFAGVGRFKDAERLRTLMDERNAFKAPGHSFV